MEIEAEGLDDLLIDLYQKLLDDGQANKGQRGDTRELLGVSLRVRKPRARISRSENRGKPFSALGELLWYLSGSDELKFIQPYVSQYKKEAVGGTIHGAYGPRFFRMRGQVDQFANVERLLRERSGSRRAVVQLFNAEDISEHYKEVPCTTTIQFLLRENGLNMSVTLRSNDAYWGLPHDFFCFTMLQEMMARRLGSDIGEYYQYVGSMHVYNEYIDDMAAYVKEGHHRSVEMPPMPTGDPFELIPQLLDVESRIRSGEVVDASILGFDNYWADVVRLLQVFWSKTPDEIDALANAMHDDAYRPYVAGRRELKERTRAKREGDA